MITADELQAVSELSLVKSARQYLAEEYEAGNFPTYAELALNGEGSFTLCSIRAIERAQESLARKVIAAEKLADALKVMVQEAVELAESGDAGFWDPEAVESMIASRAAIAAWEATQ